MEAEEPIVAEYRNTYDVALRRWLRAPQMLPKSTWGKKLESGLFILGTMVLIVANLFANVWGRDTFAPKDRVLLLVASTVVVAAWSSQFTEHGARIWTRVVSTALVKPFFRWSRSSNRVVVLTIDREGIVTHVQGQDDRHHKAWRGLAKVVQLPDGFVLPGADHWSIGWIPLEAFKSGQDIQRFVQLARDNVRDYVEIIE